MFHAKSGTQSFSSKGKERTGQHKVFPHELITSKFPIFCNKIPDKVHNVVASLRLLEALLTKGGTGLG
jgi:hypothetical protein